MDLRQLKNSIETNTFKPIAIVMVAKENFLPLMYIDILSRSYNINYIDSFEEIPTPFALFNVEDDKSLNVMIKEKVDFIPDFIYNIDNIIIITKQIDPEIKKQCRCNVIDIPDLEDWQIQDMVHSFCSGVDEKDLNQMISICDNNVYRLYNECIKINIFQENERKFLFKQMLDDNIFSDLSSNTIFDFTNAIMKKDVSALSKMFEEIDNIDINEFGLITVLYNNFSNMFKIQLGINPTPNSLGIKPGQFNAIKRLIGSYSAQQLIDSFKIICDMDRKIKSGEFPVNLLKDYLIISILST